MHGNCNTINCILNKNGNCLYSSLGYLSCPFNSKKPINPDTKFDKINSELIFRIDLLFDKLEKEYDSEYIPISFDNDIVDLLGSVEVMICMLQWNMKRQFETVIEYCRETKLEAERFAKKLITNTATNKDFVAIRRKITKCYGICSDLAAIIE